MNMPVAIYRLVSVVVYFSVRKSLKLGNYTQLHNRPCEHSSKFFVFFCNCLFDIDEANVKNKNKEHFSKIIKNVKERAKERVI